MTSILPLIARRILVSIVILFIVSALLFCILRLLPVDPAAMSMPATATIAEIEVKRHEMGLDLPLYNQYLIWAGQVLHGDLGSSIHFGRGVAEPCRLDACRRPSSSRCPLDGDRYGARHRRRAGALRVRDTRRREPVIDFGSIVLLSIPEFLWGLFFILLFGVALGVLPFTGRLSPEFQRPMVTGFLLLDTLLVGRPDMFLDALKHMILPALALGIAFSPTIMRVLRSSLIDVYQEDYIHQARLRGVSERRILVRHALKNAILPTLSLMGVQFGFLFGGTLLIEVIYSYPGMGNLMVDAVRNADLPIIQSVGLTYCVVVVVAIINIVDAASTLILNPEGEDR